MKTFRILGVAAILAAAFAVPVAQAQSHGGSHGGGGHSGGGWSGGGHSGGGWGGGHGGSWHGGGWHGSHFSVVVGAPFFWGPYYWGAPYYWGSPYYYDDYWYPRTSVAYPIGTYPQGTYPADAYPQGTIEPPTTTVPPNAPGAPAQAPAYMNYCDSARAYYPKVTSCPEGWRFVPSQPAR